LGDVMSDGKKPELVWVQPVKGVYCELMYGDQVYKVWKAHPNSPERFGTQVPYDLAVYFLGKVPPVITLVPEMKDGKRVSPLLPEDADRIAASVRRGFVGGLKNYNEVSKTQEGSGGAAPGSDEALKKALDLLAQQTAANQALQDSIAKLQEQVGNLEKAAVPADVSGDVLADPAFRGKTDPTAWNSAVPAKDLTADLSKAK
jgi:hypothetical protein